MAKTVVIFNATKTFNKYSLEQIGIVDWSEVLGNCLWVSYMSRYEDDSYMNVQSYPIWAEIKENVEKENWSEVYKLGKKFTSKVVKAKDLEMHAECAIKSMMNMMNYDNLSAIVSSEKPKVIMQTIADAINERTDDSRFAWDLKWKLTSSDKKDTIVMDFSNYKFKLIPCNDAYQYYNMEDYYDKLDFKMYDDKQLYECKSNKKSLTERKKFQYGDEVINFLENYGYYKRGEDFEQYKDYSTVTYMYAIPKSMRPQTPYIEFTVDADNDAFIFGEYFTDGRKGYSTEFDSVEDLEYFVSNANYENVDLTESKSTKTLDFDEFLDDYEADLILNDRNETIIVELRHGKVEISLANNDNINVTYLNENGNVFTKYFANTPKGHVEMLNFLQERY